MAEQKLREERASREADKSDMNSLRSQLDTKDLDKEQCVLLLLRACLMVAREDGNSHTCTHVSPSILGCPPPSS